MMMIKPSRKDLWVLLLILIIMMMYKRVIFKGVS